MTYAGCSLGMDVGSTTAKVVLLDASGEVRFSAYRRHNAETALTLTGLLSDARQSAGDVQVSPLITGSAGLGLHESYGVPFIQEVIASTELVRQVYPQVKTLLDIGGEDAKIVFFDTSPSAVPLQPDIRMNGACAGGTGAFIDQMASLLNVNIAELDALAAKHTRLHTIASRCGVFAKTDVQNLLSRHAAREDIAASIFHAVVWQTLAALARGRTAAPGVLFTGGPLTFLPQLKEAFIEALHLSPGDVIQAEHPELFPAHGAALLASKNPPDYSLSQLIDLLSSSLDSWQGKNRLEPLFDAALTFPAWKTIQAEHQVAHQEPDNVEGELCFLGIDSGSTTTKLVLIDQTGRIFFDQYLPNRGNPIQAVQTALEKGWRFLDTLPDPPHIARSAVTGYGEELIRAAFGCDDGLVETIAHFRAARAFDPEVSFILDIGGQDMKAIFVRGGYIQRIEINEACSSGCGTFIETFAHSLGWPLGDFAEAACKSDSPCDLGTRCTVFMNSSVKQALREGAEVGDISAGLAYAVVKNALHKVLKLTDTSLLGEHIVVQGGSFRNPAIHKALERVIGRPVICPDKAELMGAYGAALFARDAYQEQQAGVGITVSPQSVHTVQQFDKKEISCRGCENRCGVNKITFPNANVFYSGNRCERIFSNNGRSHRMGENMLASKRSLLFGRPMSPAEVPRAKIGIPRALNFYDSFPFWCTLLVESGFQVHLSAASDQALYEKGAATVMSENICFPAKLLHGHIFDLVEAGVDRIFYPMVYYESSPFSNAINHFNCPIVSGYPDVVRSSINPLGRYGIPLDQPAVTFRDKRLLKQKCWEYLNGLDVAEETFERAFSLALQAQNQYKEEVRQQGAQILDRARREGRLVILLAGHPYHVDPLINHNIPETLAGMGVDVITEDAVPVDPDQALEPVFVLTQWEYVNRVFHAAHWAGAQPGIEVAQLNSFGCGPDAFSIDEVREILEAAGKNLTVLRIDEVDSLGSARLRLRSMLEAWKDQHVRKTAPAPRRTTRLYQKEDRPRTILTPEFSPFCTAPIIRPLQDMGYPIEVLPPSDNESVQVGLKYTNNEICYPGIIVIGDILKAFKSGQYDPDEVIAGSWETGGQCRASNISCLLKKGLVSAGYENTPVLTLSTRFKSFNDQPGFRFNLVTYLYKAMLAMSYSDGISALYHATVVRERQRGEAEMLTEKYMQPFRNGQMPLTRTSVLDRLERAVRDFNCIPVITDRLPRVGIVGEIYVKYNPFVNHRLTQWLIDQHCEVVLPGFLTFFTGSLIGLPTAVSERLRRPDLLWLLARAGHGWVQSFLDRVEGLLHNFRHYQPHRPIDQVAQTAKKILQLTHQYGEGWLLSGEVGEFARAGINNVICLQPFGCIANQVVAKGVGNRIQERCPELNLLFLDLYAGNSEVNYHNRLHFFLQQARSRV
jgi:predicted CoA-substrate-specific enzyme activase